jgi:hypothetical protein
MLPEAVWQYHEVGNPSKEFMPDVLLHTPGDFSNQLVIMEVKSNPGVHPDDVVVM